MNGVDRGDTEPRREHPVEGRGSAAALDVTELDDPGLEARAFPDHAGDLVGDSPEYDVAEAVTGRVGHVERATARLRSFRDDHDRGVARMRGDRGQRNSRKN